MNILSLLSKIVSKGVKVHKGLKPILSAITTKDLMDEMDKNNDGNISIKEFLYWVKNGSKEGKMEILWKVVLAAGVEFVPQLIKVVL